MSTSLYRLSGAALTLSALALAAVTWAERFTGPDLDAVPPLVGAGAGPAHVASFLAFLLFLPGLTGLYLAQRARIGPIGTGGFVATAVGFWTGVLPHTVLDFAAIPETFAALPPEQATALVDRMYDAIGPLSMAGMPLVLLGMVALGIATLRARVLARWAGVAGLAAIPVAVLLGVLGGMLPAVPVPHPPVALDLALAGYGVALIARSSWIAGSVTAGPDAAADPARPAPSRR